MLRNRALLSLFALAFSAPLFAAEPSVFVPGKIGPKNNAFEIVLDSSQTAANVSNFNGNLSSATTDVQRALEALDNLDTLTTGSTWTINGVRIVQPSTAPTTAASILVRSTSGAGTYYPVVTDPARKSGINVFTASNTFNNIPVMFEKLAAGMTPSTGTLGFFANDDGHFYQVDETGAVSQIGGGGWGFTNGVISSSLPVVVGSITTSASVGTIFKVIYGNSTFWDFNQSSTTIGNVSGTTIANMRSLSLTGLSTFTVSGVLFNMSASSFVPPVAYTNPGFTGNQMWYEPSSRVLYFGTMSVTAPVYTSSGSVVLIDATMLSTATANVKLTRTSTDIMNLATTTVTAIRSFSLTDLSTMTLAGVRVDLSSTTNKFVPPNSTSNPGYVGSEMWWNTSSNTLYFGTNTVVGSGGGGGGATINLQDTIQNGATFYVSSGTVAGTFTVQSVAASGAGSMSSKLLFVAPNSTLAPFDEIVYVNDSNDDLEIVNKAATGSSQSKLSIGRQGFSFAGSDDTNPSFINSVGATMFNSTGAVTMTANTSNATFSVYQTTAMPASRTIFKVGVDNSNYTQQELFTISPASTTIGSVGSMTFAGASTITVSDAVDIRTVSTVTGSSTTVTISTHQNNYPVAGNYTIYRTSASVAVNLTGFGNTYDGRQVCLMNVGPGTITFKHENASSTAANRFIGAVGADFTLVSGDSQTIWYDNTTQRWRLKK